MDYIHSTFAPRLTDAVTGAAVCDPSGRRADARSRRRAIADTVGASRRATPLARLRGSAARQAASAVGSGRRRGNTPPPYWQWPDSTRYPHAPHGAPRAPAGAPRTSGMRPPAESLHGETQQIADQKCLFGNRQTKAYLLVRLVGQQSPSRTPLCSPILLTSFEGEPCMC